MGHLPSSGEFRTCVAKHGCRASGPEVEISIAADGADHPILKSVNAASIWGKGSLYIVNSLTASTTPLLIGAIPEKAPETIAWTNRTKFGGTAFYTSLGYIDDFAQPVFRKLLANAVRWTVSKNTLTE